MKRKQDKPIPSSMKKNLKEEKKESLQFSLLEVDTKWEKEWQNMPEFIQEDLQPWKTLLVHFKDIEDLQDFAEVIGQKLTDQTRSKWHPATEFMKTSHYRYIDES